MKDTKIVETIENVRPPEIKGWFNKVLWFFGLCRKSVYKKEYSSLVEAQSKISKLEASLDRASIKVKTLESEIEEAKRFIEVLVANIEPNKREAIRQKLMPYQRFEYLVHKAPKFLPILDDKEMLPEIERELRIDIQKFVEDRVTFHISYAFSPRELRHNPELVLKFYRDYLIRMLGKDEAEKFMNMLLQKRKSFKIF